MKITVFFKIKLYNRDFQKKKNLLFGKNYCLHTSGQKETISWRKVKFDTLLDKKEAILWPKKDRRTSGKREPFFLQA